MLANEHDPTNQVYSKLAELNFRFCQQSCGLSLANRGGGDQSLLENQHGISQSLHHSLEQRLVCRALAGHLWLLDLDCVSTTRESSSHELFIELGVSYQH